MADTKATRARPQSIEWRRFRSASAVLGAMTLHVAAQAGMILSRSDFSWSAFRGYAAGDQLSYMGIVINASHGNFSALEPFTETGSIFYPRAYYLVLGAVSDVFGISPTASWSIVGILVQALFVGVIACACVVLSGRAWTGLLGAAPFVLGTFSIYHSDGWFTHLDSHAVLWGGYGVLFPLNAEAAGLCVGAGALVLILVAHIRLSRSRARTLVFVVCALAIGGIANMQTYSFLTATYVASFVLAAVTLIRSRSVWASASSGALVIALFLGAPLIHDQVGPLALLILGLSPAVPGVIAAIRSSRGLVAALYLLAALAASPSVFRTLQGLHAQDPFLTYRVASTANLGVPWLHGMLAATVLVIPLGLVFLAGLHRRRPLWSGYSVGVAVAWVLLASNDVWGANQEPYRLWIDSFFFVAATLPPMLVLVAREYLAGSEDSEPSDLVTPARSAPISASSRRVAKYAIAMVVAVALLSLADWVSFVRENRGIELLTFDGPREVAVGASADPIADGLVLTDPCVDPVMVKVVTGERVVYMNLGMAWPEKYQEVRSLLEERVEGRLDLATARAAEVTWLLTDSACSFDWPTAYSDALVSVKATPYLVGGETGTITLWRLDSA